MAHSSKTDGLADEDRAFIEAVDEGLADEKAGRTVSYEKVRRYLQNGTSEVWQFYPKSRTVHIYRGDAGCIIDPEGFPTTDLLPGLRLPVAPLFK